VHACTQLGKSFWCLCVVCTHSTGTYLVNVLVWKRIRLKTTFFRAPATPIFAFLRWNLCDPRQLPQPSVFHQPAPRNLFASLLKHTFFTKVWRVGGSLFDRRGDGDGKVGWEECMDLTVKVNIMCVVIFGVAVLWRCQLGRFYGELFSKAMRSRKTILYHSTDLVFGRWVHRCVEFPLNS
jgi:hypothetical protein